jgi:hypothetical protein
LFPSRKPRRTGGDDGTDEGDSSSITRFSLLRYTTDGRNQAYILVAVLFLIKKLEGLKISTQKKAGQPLHCDASFFKSMATNLEVDEPALKGVTGMALSALYDRLIRKYKDLNMTMAEAGGAFTPTYFLDLVEKLSILHEYLFESTSSSKDKHSEKRGEKRDNQSSESSADSFAIFPNGTIKRQRGNSEPVSRKPESVECNPGIQSSFLLQTIPSSLQGHVEGSASIQLDREPRHDQSNHALDNIQRHNLNLVRILQILEILQPMAAEAILHLQRGQ